MKSYIITIFDNEKSVQSAQRCIQSAAHQDVDVEMFKAVTPANTPKLFLYALSQGINPDNFVERYSRQENCVAAFLSHFTLWQQAVTQDEEIQIFEHDAIVVGRLPQAVAHSGCLNLGRPSYGKFNRPTTIGVGPLVSKRYFPGAHAYRVTPYGAKRLIAAAQIKAAPTDVFLHLDRFPWLQEYYPWPVEARDTFTTIQKPEGCAAKHNYRDGYEIL